MSFFAFVKKLLVTYANSRRYLRGFNSPSTECVCPCLSRFQTSRNLARNGTEFEQFCISLRSSNCRCTCFYWLNWQC